MADGKYKVRAQALSDGKVLTESEWPIDVYHEFVHHQSIGAKAYAYAGFLRAELEKNETVPDHELEYIGIPVDVFRAEVAALKKKAKK